jgi:hypothetical protein
MGGWEGGRVVGRERGERVRSVAARVGAGRSGPKRAKAGRSGAQREGVERRGVVLTRSGAFLIIICLSLGISRGEEEEMGNDAG